MSLREEKLPSPRGGRPRLRTMVGFRLRPPMLKSEAPVQTVAATADEGDG